MIIKKMTHTAFKAGKQDNKNEIQNNTQIYIEVISYYGSSDHLQLQENR